MLCGRILEPPPDRGCVRRTSRSKCGCAKSLNDSKTRGLAVSLRLVLRTQPRSVSANFWWWHQDAPRVAAPALPGRFHFADFNAPAVKVIQERVGVRVVFFKPVGAVLRFRAGHVQVAV